MAVATASTRNVMMRCVLSGIWLVVPVPVAATITTFLNMLSVPEDIAFGSFPIGVVLFYVISGAMWARQIGRIFGWQSSIKLGLVGALGVTLPIVVAITVLGILEQDLINLSFDGWRMHILFGLLFVPTAFLITAIGTGTLGLVIGDWHLARRLALACGLTAALTFLVVMVIFDLLGMRVGAPGAAERATMMVVTLVGMWAAALTGNATLAWVLERRSLMKVISEPVS